MSDTRSEFVEDALRRLRTLLRFHAIYVKDVREVLEDLASREIAEALGNDTLARSIHGAPNLVKRIEALEGQLETVLAQTGVQRPRPRLVDTEVPKRKARVPSEATTCSKGHPLSGENLAIHKNGARICKACKRDYFRDWSRRRADKRRMGDTGK